MAGTLQLVVCIAGIWISFLAWGVLQERILTTPYGPDNRLFRTSNVITGVQSALACVVGYFFLRFKQTRGKDTQPLIPRSFPVLRGYVLVAACQALSSPLAYASLRYVDYISVTLAKSCKLLPVMAVHLLLYRTRYPLYKYGVVGLVTAGVCVFSLYHPSSSHKSSTESKNQTWGLVLLTANLLLDGLYNTTQDQMFKTQRGLTGPHMMTSLNFLTAIFGIGAFMISGPQRAEAIWFARNHPQVYRDIALYGFCGAIGQVFVFVTLEKFGSLVLVTTTVTRKMMSMLLSVAMFGHHLAAMQWAGVAMVFGGVVAEALAKTPFRKQKTH